MRETAQELRIEAEVPGITEGDLAVELVGDMLTISGKRRCARADDRDHLAERSFGVFRHSIRLPFAPESGSVRASFRNGVLIVTMPHVADERRRYRIPIGGAASAAAH